MMVYIVNFLKKNLNLPSTLYPLVYQYFIYRIWAFILKISWIYAGDGNSAWSSDGVDNDGDGKIDFPADIRVVHKTMTKTMYQSHHWYFQLLHTGHGAAVIQKKRGFWKFFKEYMNLFKKRNSIISNKIFSYSF